MTGMTVAWSLQVLFGRPIMIHPSIPAGIPDPGACSDCIALSVTPGARGGQSVFSRVLNALMGGADVQAAGSLPLQGAIMDKADTAGTLSSESANLPTEGLGDPTDTQRTAGVEVGLAADAPAAGTEQAADANLLGAWPLLTQSGAIPIASHEAGRDGLHASALGATVSATFAGGRQQLPLSLPVAPDEGSLPGLAALTPASVGGDADLSGLITADTVSRPAQQPVPTALLAPERTLESAKTLPSREMLSMQLPLRAAGWDGELAQRIVWMAGRQAQWAEISLNPPNFGSIEVHLALKGNDASAYFFSPHAAVREVIEDSLSRLRQMLADAGINLGQTQVSQESFGERRGGDAMRFAASGEAGVERATLAPVHGGRGLVDLYV